MITTDDLKPGADITAVADFPQHRLVYTYHILSVDNGIVYYTIAKLNNYVTNMVSPQRISVQQMLEMANHIPA